MEQIISENHFNDAEGNPAGGVTTGTGIAIQWQDGPLGRHAEGCKEVGACVEGCTRRPPNGAFVEGVIQAAVGRVKYYQNSKFACQENADALAHLELALESLSSRTKKREARAVEGTHTA